MSNPYTWGQIGKFAVRNRRKKWSKKSRRRRAEASKQAHEQDTQRQEREKGLRWDLIRHLLDNTPGLTLEAAKRKSKRIRTWDI